MCFGGGTTQTYDAYNAHGTNYYKKYEDSFNTLADDYLAQAAAGAPIDDSLMDFSSLDKQAGYIRRDPQAATDMEELQRQYNIKLGQAGIDRAFSQFGDDYFNKYKTDYTDYYNPQLDTQFGTAKSKLTAALANRGILESTSGFDALGNITKDYTDARTNIANQALDAAQQLRGNIESSKSNLYASNQLAADPQSANTQALGAASALVAAPQYNPLGDVFASALSPFLNYAQNKGGGGASYSSPYSNVAAGSGSGTVVR